MDQKEWEERLDRYADRTADAVRKGVHVLEDAFDKGAETLREDAAPKPEGEPQTGAKSKGTPRLGLALIALGIVWLLHTLHVLDQPVFPILLIVLGIYFLVRSR